MPKHSFTPVPLSPPLSDGSPLRATEAGTTAFAAKFDGKFTTDYFRRVQLGEGLTLSSIGAGTYLGDATPGDDRAYETAIRHSVRSGINLIDTAINYRAQRSERAIGAALRQALAAGEATRDEVVICSKGGYLPLDGAPPASREEYQAYIQREFIDQEIVLRDEIVAGGHSLAPRFLRFCLAKSRQNLGLRTIDVYYLHNPEQQLASVPADELSSRLRAAFSMLEESASRGEIGAYGCATWDGLRIPPGTKGHLSLEELVRIAREVAGDAHRFRVVQLPINLAMPEAVGATTQSLNGKPVSVLQAAEALGVSVVASATLMQSQLTRGLPDAVRTAFPHCSTDAQRAIAFTRSLPGVTATLVGMKRPEHVDENLGAARP